MTERRDGNAWTEFYRAIGEPKPILGGKSDELDEVGTEQFDFGETARPACPSCSLPMRADPCPRLPKVPAADGVERRFWLCSWDWTRLVTTDGERP